MQQESATDIDMCLMRVHHFCKYLENILQNYDVETHLIPVSTNDMFSVILTDPSQGYWSPEQPKQWTLNPSIVALKIYCIPSRYMFTSTQTAVNGKLYVDKIFLSSSTQHEKFNYTDKWTGTGRPSIFSPIHTASHVEHPHLLYARGCDQRTTSHLIMQLPTAPPHTLCLKKVPTFKLSVALSNILNRFSKVCHSCKAHEICYKTHTTIPTCP